ncbi:hypothetical protein BH11ARM1_BH11ARM1_06580 [soil metagenome]
MIFAVAALGAVAALAVQVRSVSALPPAPVVPVLAPVPVIEESVLAGCKVFVSVEQDLAHTPFLGILRRALEEEDALEVGTRSEAQYSIIGSLVCNGYPYVYYTAEFTCFEGDSAICTTIEKPPHGDRPANLALSILARLKKELVSSTTRVERRVAIDELSGP